MGIQVVRIDADVHEPERIRAELSRLGVDVHRRLLATGDYRVEGVLVERKTVRDVHAQRRKGATPEAVLAAIPEISTVSARALLAHFGSVAAIVNAPDADLTAVPGIGPVRAQRLKESLNHPYYAYRSRQSRERPGLST